MARTKRKRRCACCGEPFVPARSDQRYVNAAHRQVAHRARQVEWRADELGNVFRNGRFVGVLSPSSSWAQGSWTATGQAPDFQQVLRLWRERTPRLASAQPRSTAPTRATLEDLAELKDLDTDLTESPAALQPEVSESEAVADVLEEYTSELRRPANIRILLDAAERIRREGED